MFATKWRSSLHQVQNEVFPFSGWQWMTFWKQMTVRPVWHVALVRASGTAPEKMNFATQRLHWSRGVQRSHFWLVVWNMNFMTFHSVGNGKIIPTDFNSMIFQRGWLKPPTRLWLTIINHIITIINHYYWPSLLLLPEYTTNQYNILNQRENLSSKKDFASKGLLLSSPCAEVHRTAVVMLRVLPSLLVLKWFGTWKSREKIIEKKNYDG